MFDFLPVLLGSDANVYGMARSFYQQYGVRSVAICKGALVATSNTNLVKIAVLEPDLENDETFVKTLTDYAKAHADKPLVLVSCADGYTVLMGRHRDALGAFALRRRQRRAPAGQRGGGEQQQAGGEVHGSGAPDRRVRNTKVTWSLRANCQLLMP